MFRSTIFSLLIALVSPALLAETPDTVFLEELTWTEVRNAIDSGTTTIIVPTAGTEQNGPHMVLGKHKYRMNAGAERIARALGDALVAPVMTYVPEGSIDPPSGHMRYAGTISISQELFRSLLEQTARSLKVHGFTDILFIGDSGPNQPGMNDVSIMLNKEWANERTRVHYISDWYTSTAFEEWLLDQGYSEEALGTHAGLLDTSLLLAVAPEHVRTELMTAGKGRDIDGIVGDPTESNAEIGQIGMDFTFDAAMKQIRSLRGERERAGNGN
jgi:creatinine amidohydrolase/Fe(II)-dependent formamide hydrolase-like protein